jgi:hypothetical protein
MEQYGAAEVPGPVSEQDPLALLTKNSAARAAGANAAIRMRSETARAMSTAGIRVDAIGISVCLQRRLRSSCH